MQVIFNTINTNFYPASHTTFRGPVKSIFNPDVAGGLLEATLAGSAVYGMAQFKELKKEEDIVSIKSDENGKELYRTVMTPSKVVGEFNITKILPNEESEILSSVKNSKTEGFDIQMNFVSPSGTKTIYQKTGKTDNYKISYMIKDKEGNEKLNFIRNFNKIDTDTTETSANGKTYINSFGILGVESINKNNSDDKNFMIINYRFEDLLRKLPAEIFYCMQKNNIRLIIDNCDNEGNSFISGGRMMHISEELKDDPFVFAHEVGHVKSDELGDLSTDKELQEIFEQEKEEAFKNMGYEQQNILSNFILNPMGLDEAAAETFAILTGLGHDGVQTRKSLRKALFMQYFPNTIAYIANKYYGKE